MSTKAPLAPGPGPNLSVTTPDGSSAAIAIPVGKIENVIDPNLPSTVANTIQFPIAGVPVPPENYAAAFDPNQNLYSVNTGNASVQQLEDLAALASTPPEAAPDNTLTYVSIGFIILLIFNKGRA